MDIGTLSFTGEPALPTGKPSSSPDSGATGENPYLPKPLEALQETPVPPFLTKTYELVDDPALDPTLSWGLKGDSFVVWNEVDFARTVLPQHFKHGNFSSFVRQLNTYVGILETEPNEGFRKVDSDRYEFANEDFLRGKKHLLKNIHRHKSTGHFLGSSIESRKAGFEFEVENLKHGRDILMQEVLNLQHQQHLLADQFTLMNQRLQIAEQKQKQMISFMIKSIRNPAFLTHLLHQKENRDLSSNKIKRKFLKQQSSPVSSMEEQIVRNITDLGSTVPSLVMPESSEIPEIGNFLLDNAKSSVEVKQEPVHLFDQKGYEVSSPRLLNSPDTFFNGKSVFEPIVKQEEKLSMDFDSGVRDYGSCSNWEDGLCSYEEQELVGDCGLYGFWDLQELEEVSQINLWESQVEDAKEDHPQSLQQLWVPF